MSVKQNARRLLERYKTKVEMKERLLAGEVPIMDNKQGRMCLKSMCKHGRVHQTMKIPRDMMRAYELGRLAFYVTGAITELPLTCY
jgi:hypothetical protein